MLKGFLLGLIPKQRPVTGDLVVFHSTSSSKTESEEEKSGKSEVKKAAVNCFQ